MLLTSVIKGMDVAVEQAITDSADGKFTNEPYVGTLENGGVGLAPFTSPDAEVDEELDGRRSRSSRQGSSTGRSRSADRRSKCATTGRGGVSPAPTCTSTVVLSTGH